MLINGILNFIILCKYPKYAEYEHDEMSDEEAKQKVTKLGIDVVKSNPELAKQGVNYLVKNSLNV